MNPYEAPQTLDKPPLPLAIQQTHLEQVSFRHLSEIAWSFALPGQIMIAALLTGLVLVGVTWQFYVPGKNPNWVTIVMLGCGSILAVLVCWAGIMGSVAYSTLAKYVRKPPTRSKREHVQMVLFMMSAIYSIPPILMEFRSQLAWGALLLLLPLILFLSGLTFVIKQHAKILEFLRSFLPQVTWRLSGSELRHYSLAGAAVTMTCLFVMNLESVPGSIAWGWLMLAFVGVIAYVVPFMNAYRQLARELDKLWP